MARVMRFDRVFGPDSQQVELFQDLLPLADAVFRGRNACIVAYGPSGSGKTHSLYGPPTEADHPAALHRPLRERQDLPGPRAAPRVAASVHPPIASGAILPDSAGIIPRVLAYFLNARRTTAVAADIAAAGVAGADCEPDEELDSQPPLAVHTVHLSVCEIYNDEVRDLLEPSASVPVTSGEGGGAAELATVSLHSVTSPKDGEALLARAVASRSARATRMNDASSRSHMLVRIRVAVAASWRGATDEREAQGPLVGTLAILDLAGSERARQSGARGAALREAGCVNRSLSALGNVVLALACGDKFVPFRDSKLTRVMQPYMGGKSRVVLLLALSDSARVAALTLRTLQFGARVAAVRLA